MIFRKKETIRTLDDVLKWSWKALHKGVINFRHPYHRPALATMDGDKPMARTVILRGFSEKDRTLICHCDARSPKVSQIEENPQVSWLFYDPSKWTQLRLSGTAIVHRKDETAENQWKKVRPTHRMNYSSEMPPGAPTERPASGLPGVGRPKASGTDLHSKARENFAVIVGAFHEMDWLMLKLTGHMRARFYWDDHGVAACWVVP